MSGWLLTLTKCVKNWRAFDCNGRLFVTRQMSNRRLVETSTSVYIDGIGDFIHGF